MDKRKRKRKKGLQMSNTTRAIGATHGRSRPPLLRVTAGASTAATALLAAALVLTAAPDAAAAVTGLQAFPGTPAVSWGPQSQYGTGCTYTLTATVTGYGPVSFADWTGAATFYPSNYIHPGGGKATVSWTPNQPGWHRISAYQTSAGGPAIDLLVGTGVNTGSACVVLP